MNISKLALAAVLGLGLTAGLASTASARLADYAELMSQDQLNRAIKRAEKKTGVKIAEVAEWSREHAAEYDRFWRAFAYNYQECVNVGQCVGGWDYFGINGDGDSGDGGDGGDGGAGGGGGGGGGR